MGYYAAGGYYSAGGFSLKKLVKAVGRAATYVQKQPLLSGIVGVIPGASMALSGATVVAGMAHEKSATNAVQQSMPGTPGTTAAVAAGNIRGKRTRRPRWRRVRVYG